MRLASLLLLSALAAALPLAAEATPLTIVNGNFATPAVAGPYVTYPGGSTAITGWTVTGNSVDLIGTYWQAPPGGGQSVDLDGDAPGGLSQTLATTAGQSYTISFELSGNPDGPPTTKQLSVSAGLGAELYTYTIGSNTHADMMYVPETYTFTALGSSTTLSFLSGDEASAYGPVIGDVAAVPEPLSILMFGSALAGLGLIRRRRA